MFGQPNDLGLPSGLTFKVKKMVLGWSYREDKNLDSFYGRGNVYLKGKGNHLHEVPF